MKLFISVTSQFWIICENSHYNIMSLVYMIWHNSEMTWFILNNLVDVFMNADCAFSDKLTYIKEFIHCCCKFKSQQMLEL